MTQNCKLSFFFRPFTEIFHKHPMEIDLTQACVGELNTTMRGDTNWPIVYGVGVNTRTGEIFPATFPDKGPDIQLRWDFFHCEFYSSKNLLYSQKRETLHWRSSGARYLRLAARHVTNWSIQLRSRERRRFMAFAVGWIYFAAFIDIAWGWAAALCDASSRHTQIHSRQSISG